MRRFAAIRRAISLPLVLLLLAGKAPMTEQFPGNDKFAADVRAQLARCGVEPKLVSVRYESVMQDYAVTISESVLHLTDAQLACVAQFAVSTGRWIGFADAMLAQRYGPLYEAATSRDAREAAANWLSARSLLAGLPVFDPARQSLAAFAQDLERHCGVERGSVLVVLDDKLLTVRPGSLKPSMIVDDAVSCLMNAVTASNLEEHGVSFGFIGNEVET